MNFKYSYFLLFLLFFLSPKSRSAEKLFLYKGTFSRSIKIEELDNFKKYKLTSNKLRSLIKLTNQKEENLHKIFSYEVEIPLKASSKLMNSKIGEIFLSRLSKIIHPNKIFTKDIRIKSIRSGIILSSYYNNEKINLLDFFKAYPNKNIAINLTQLNKALKKIESLTELIEFYSDSPFKKLKDGSSSI